MKGGRVMARNFRGSKDDWAVILSNVFPNSDIVVSTPVEFSGQRSGVYVEGDSRHLEIIFGYLKKLIDVYLDETMFGRWIAVTPPEEGKIIIHYEAMSEPDKIQLLNFVLPKHLAMVCNFCLSVVSDLTLRLDGKIVQENFVVLPEEWRVGEIFLPKLVEDKKTVFLN
jgi:hypothetical protein